MKKRRFSLPLVLGLLLIFISLAMVIVSQFRAYVGSKSCREATAQMNELLPERTTGIPETASNATMPILQIDGVDYVALLEIPSFDVTLPVADKWQSDRLFRSPARFYGSAYADTLVIGGKDDSYQFSFCDKLDVGTVITVTDMTGTQFSYTVCRVDRSQNAESDWLADKDFDLTLFCRDTYSMEYVAVRCSFVYF